MEALRSEEEQDSDVYFVIKAAEPAEHPDDEGFAGADDDDGSELGTAHVNLEELLRKEQELSRQRLPVVAEGGATLGHLVVSVQCLAAMRFASAKLTPSGGSTPLGMDVRVEDVSLAAPAMLRLDDLLSSRRVRVDVDMPPGVCAKPLSSKPVKIAKGKGHFKFAGTVGIEPGSSGHNALLSALEVASKAREKKAIRGRGADGGGSSDETEDEEDAAAEEAAEVLFTLVAVGGGAGERDRELGNAAVSLQDILEEGRDVASRQIELVDESGGLRRPLGKLRVSVGAIVLLTALQQSQRSVERVLQPPTLRHLLETHIAKLRGLPPPAIQPTGPRKGELDQKEEETLTAAALTAAEKVKAPQSAAAAEKILDDLSVKSIPALAKQLRRQSGESAAAHTERVSGALDDILSGARRLASTACGLGTRKNDFSEAAWPKARIEKLYHLCVLLATRAEAYEQMTTAAQRYVDLQGRLEAAAKDATLSRMRRRLNEAERATERQGAPSSVARRRELAAVQEAFALREVTAAYERLMRGMHATLSTLGAHHVALASRFDESEVLHTGPSPLAQAGWVEHSVAAYGRALERCAVASAPPLDLFEGGASEGLELDGGRGGGRGGVQSSPLSPASIDELRAAVAVALGEPPPASSSALSASTSRPRRWPSSTLAPATASRSPGLHGRHPSRWAEAGRSTVNAPPISASDAPDPDSVHRQASSGAPCSLQISARTLRLRGDTLDRAHGEMLRLSFRLLPASLRLPTLATPTEKVRDVEIQLGYDEQITFASDGDAFRALLELLAGAPRASDHSPSGLLLHVHLSSTSSSGVNRFLGEARVPLAPLLHQSAAPRPTRAAPTVLLSSDGSVAADVLVTAAAPELMAALHGLTRRAATIDLTVHDLSLDPRVLATSGAWGVWVQTDLFATASHSPAALDGGGRPAGRPGRSNARAPDDDASGSAGLVRTPSNPFDAHGTVQFGHSTRVAIPEHSAAERRLLETLSSASGGEVTLDLEVWGSGPTGASLLAKGSLPVAIPPSSAGFGEEGWVAAAAAAGGRASSSDLYLRRVPLTATSGSGGGEAGEVRVTLLCAEVLRAAASRLQRNPEIQIGASQLCLSAAMQADVSLRSVWLEVHLPPPLLSEPEADKGSPLLSSQRLYATRGVLSPRITTSLTLTPHQLTRLGGLLHESPSATVLPRVAPRSPAGGVRSADGEGVEAGRASPAAAAGPASRFSFGILGRGRAKATAGKGGVAAGADGVENISGNGGRGVEPLAPSLASPSSSVSMLAGHGAHGAASTLAVGGLMAAAGAGVSAACVQFVLRGDGYHGEKTLGVGSIDLRQMLLSGEEKLLVGVELKDVFGQQVALVHASVVALQALRLAWWSHARHEHIGLVAHTARLDAAAMRRASHGGPLSAWVEVDIEGVPGPLGRSAEAMLSGVDLPLHYATELWVPSHSDGARALEAALRMPEGAPMTFRLYGRPAGEDALAVAPHDQSDPGHEVVELGTSTVRLRTLLSCGGDMLREPLPLVDAWGGTSGELTVSVLASEATTRLFGVRSWEGESIRLVVHGVSLDDPQASARMLLPPGAAKDGTTEVPPALLWLEVDLMGLPPKATGLKSREISRRLHEVTAAADGGSARGGAAAVGGGGARLELFADWEVSLTEGGVALGAVREALRSDEEQDSDVYFVVKARADPKKGKKNAPPPAEETTGRKGRKESAAVEAKPSSEVELGTAHVNLEEALRLGEEPTRQRLPLVLQANGKRVGWLTASVSCLDALRWAKRAVDEEAKIGLSVRELSLFPQCVQKHAALLVASRVEVRVLLPSVLAETLAALEDAEDDDGDGEAAPAPAPAPALLRGGSAAASAEAVVAYRTKAAKLTNGKHAYSFDAKEADAHAGSAVHAALLSLLDAAASARVANEPETEAAASDILFHVVILVGDGGGGEAVRGAAAAKARSAAAKATADAAGKEKERLVGVARLNLLDLLDQDSDAKPLSPLPLWDKATASKPLSSKLADVAAATAAATAAAAAVAKSAAASNATPAAPAAVKAAHSAGQLRTLAVGTSLLQALKIAQRQLKARHSHSALRAAPAVPSIAAATTSSPASAFGEGSMPPAPPPLLRTSSSFGSTGGTSVFSPSAASPYATYPSFPATPGTTPSVGGGIHASGIGGGGLGGGAAGQSLPLRAASVAAGVASSMGSGCGVPGVSATGSIGGSAPLRRSEPQGPSYRSQEMREEAVRTSFESRGDPRNTVSSSAASQPQTRPSRYQEARSSGGGLTSSGPTPAMPALRGSGTNVTRAPGLIGDLEDDDNW